MNWTNTSFFYKTPSDRVTQLTRTAIDQRRNFALNRLSKGFFQLSESQMSEINLHQNCNPENMK